VEAVSDLLRAADDLGQEEGLGNVVLDTVGQLPEPLINVGLAGQEDDGNLAGLLAGAELFKQLLAVEAGHAVVGHDEVGFLLDGLQQGVGAVGGGDDLAVGLDALAEQGQDGRVVLGNENANAFACHQRGGRR
jgi:hypothetical protein